MNGMNDTKLTVTIESIMIILENNIAGLLSAYSFFARYFFSCSQAQRVIFKILILKPVLKGKSDNEISE